MRWKIIAVALGLAALGGFLFFIREGRGARPSQATIYFSCDVRGRLSPCGCFSGQNGGLTRLKTFLASRAAPSDIRVDVGDAIAGPEDYQLIQYRYIQQAMADMKYDAINIGQREARLAVDQLQKLKASSPVPVISANLLDAKTGTRIFEPYRILERGNRKIAIIGVIDPVGLGDELGSGLKIMPIDETLSAILPAVKKQAQSIILLAFTDETGLTHLAQQFFELDLILGGKVSQPSQRLVRINRSAIVYTANESRTIGVVEAQTSPKFDIRNFQMVLLGENFAEDPTILGLVSKYRDEIRNTHLAIDDLKKAETDIIPGIRNRASYAGTETCLECHKEAGGVWSHTQHADAFATLVKKKADADPSCIACHTVGFGTPSGYRRDYNGSKLANVTCETCHGPGSLHVEMRKAKANIEFKFRPLDAGDCKSCHYGEFSRPFDWESFWPKIKHGKEPPEPSNPSM